MSVDAAFTKAVATIKQLANGPSSLGIPPPDRRHKLYGLFKQSMEGNVDGIMSRPGDDEKNAQLKWDAWKAQEGLSKQEAKLEYVRFLLETMRSLRKNDETPLALVELERVYEEASLQRSVESLPIPLGIRSRGLSTTSTNSTYSHFLRSKPTYSEFGLSERDHRELQADRIVGQMQTAFPPIIPGAVPPEHHSTIATVATSVNNSTCPTPRTHIPNNAEGLEALKMFLKYMKKWITLGFNRLLYNATLDLVKLFTVLTIIRLIASKPQLIRKLPISNRLLTALIKLLKVFMDELGVEIKLR